MGTNDNGHLLANRLDALLEGSQLDRIEVLSRLGWVRADQVDIHGVRHHLLSEHQGHVLGCLRGKLQVATAWLRRVLILLIRKNCHRSTDLRRDQVLLGAGNLARAIIQQLAHIRYSLNRLAAS